MSPGIAWYLLVPAVGPVMFVGLGLAQGPYDACKMSYNALRIRRNPSKTQLLIGVHYSILDIITLL